MKLLVFLMQREQSTPLQATDVLTEETKITLVAFVGPLLLCLENFCRYPLDEPVVHTLS